MKTKNNRFLDKGIKRYEEARDTISAFEQEMGKILEHATTCRKDWRPLRVVKFGRPSPDRAAGQYGYWIALAVKGKSSRGERVVIDCGLWWKCGKVDAPIIYANYYYEPKRVMGFVWNNINSDIRSFFAWKRTFLYLPLRKREEIEGSLNRILGALLKQLK
jgi:hypothetical protein